jgi:hypothetical protein
MAIKLNALQQLVEEIQKQEDLLDSTGSMAGVDGLSKDYDDKRDLFITALRLMNLAIHSLTNEDLATMNDEMVFQPENMQMLYNIKANVIDWHGSLE